VPTTETDVAFLRASNQRVVALAKEALGKFWATLDLTDPVGSRDALLEFMPQLVALYGQAAATVAADWYENIRAKDVPGRFTAVLAESAPAEQVQRNVRYQAGALFSDTPMAMLNTLGGALQLHVVNAGRETIRSNAYRDIARPRYARVPTGGKTCAFCLMLASRGFVYASAATAGKGDKYHHDCDCQAIVDFTDDPRIDGYDPGYLYDVYRAARASSGGTDISTIAAEVRRQFPDLVSDGVVAGG
jgi:hypothetical protein